MPRTSASQPRMGSAKGGVSAGRRSHSVTVPPAKLVLPLAGVLKGFSARASVADMTRLSADAAVRDAERRARSEGMAPAQAKGFVRRARAEAIKRAAKAAHVSPVTARRWAAGTQKASAKVDVERKRAMQRTMGGAREVQAAQIAATRTVSLGRVRVTIYGEPDKWRVINNISVDPAVMAQVAQLWRSGDSDGALKALQHHVIQQYDTAATGLATIMTINDVPNPTTWA